MDSSEPALAEAVRFVPAVGRVGFAPAIEKSESVTGFEGFLPFLNEGRQYHACARYTDPYGKNVEIFVKSVLQC